MKKIMQSPLVLVIAAFLMFFSVNIIADHSLRGAHLDMTEGKLYSLSDGTEQIMESLKGEVKLEFYFSRSLAAPYPTLLAYGKRIETLARSLADCSNGMMSVSIIDPEPFSEAEDRALEYGIKGIPVGTGENLYMGLRISDDTDGEQVIAFLSEEREKFLEYDLVKAIAGLDQQGKPTVALLTGLPMQFGLGGPQAAMQGQSRPYVLYTQMQENYKIVNLNKDFTELPKTLDVLLLVHPPELAQAQQDLIASHIMAGGKTLIFIDPHAEAVNPRAYAPQGSDMRKLLSKFGVQLQAGKVIGDAGMAQKVSMGGSGADSVKDYILWLNVTKDRLDDADVVTSSLENLALATAGSLAIVDGAQTKVTPLITSSNDAMLFDAKLAVGMPNPDSLLRDLKIDGQNHMIAARISGEIEGSKPLNLFVMADSDLFDDRFWVQVQAMMGQQIAVPSAGNGSFVLGLIDQMAGSDALLQLRARGITQRPFTKVDEIRRKAEARYQNQEHALEQQLQAAEKRIAALEAEKPQGGGGVLSKDQQVEIEKFRSEMLDTRKALRLVKHKLRDDIEWLGSVLAFLNILLLPSILAGIGLIILWYRRQRSSIRPSR